MKEVKDPEIKLFGKKICLPENGDIIHAGEDSSGDSGVGNSPGFDSDCKKVIGVEESETEIEDEKIGVVAENCESLLEEKESQNVEVVSVCEDSPDSTYMDEDCTEKHCSDTENDQGDTNNSQQKTLKKPDKILPCPRCNSMDTKFCYYNNYNVNQPRHFCKSCQRYWTAGGTMRNVPVGAGRRKNKNFASHCHPITVTEAIQAAQMDAPNGFCHPNFKPNGSILSFGPELPLSDSVASVLNLTDKKVAHGGSNGFYKLDPIPSVCEKGAGNATNCSSGSSSVAHEPVLQHMNGFPFPVPYFPGVPWPFPLNPAVPISAFCPPGYPMPIYPAHLWNCSVTGGWSFPWLPPSTPPASQNSFSSPNPSTLGKHSRDGEVNKPKDFESKEWQEPKSSEGSVLIPKTLRIDDPEEAAKSSIWTTLGIKYDSKRRGGLFKAFEQKTNEKKHFPSSTSTSALQLNPAAFSRSVTFQETV